MYSMAEVGVAKEKAKDTKEYVTRVGTQVISSMKGGYVQKGEDKESKQWRKERVKKEER